jgi:glutamine cyclotransferase
VIKNLVALMALALFVGLDVASGQGRPTPPLPPVGSRAPVSSYRVVHAFPHDRQAFTQGLEYHDGAFFEGTGLHGSSTVRKVDPATGRVLQQIAVEREYFGEGITLWQSQLLQLTWQSHLGFVYDRGTFKRLRTFQYEGEGWGLTHDQTSIIMSDGSASLRFLDPATLAERRTLLVTDAGVPIRDLNELEYVAGEIYANIWQTDFVARISPSTGRVVGWIDLRGLLPTVDRAGTDVLNGIAYDTAARRLFVTGKLWPKVFEIALVSRARS